MKPENLCKPEAFHKNADSEPRNVYSLNDKIEAGLKELRDDNFESEEEKDELVKRIQEWQIVRNSQR